MIALLAVVIFAPTQNIIYAQQPGDDLVFVDAKSAPPINPLPPPVDRRAIQIRLEDNCYKDASLTQRKELAAWHTLNCRVRHVATGGMSAAAGLALLAVIWAGFVAIQNAVLGNSDEGGGSAKIMVAGAIGGLGLAILAYSLATLLNTGLVPYVPYLP